MVNPFGFLRGGRGQRKRGDTESGEKQKAERQKIDEADKEKLRPAHASLEPDEKLEDSDEEQQRKMFAKYTKYMLAELNEKTVPIRPLAKAKFFLQKYTMIAAALKIAEAKHAQLQLETERIGELSDEESEEEDDDDKTQKAKEKAAARAKLSKRSMNLAKIALDDLEDLAELRRKAEYARQKAEEAYHNLPFRHKIAFKIWSLFLRYFRGEPDIFGNPHISYTSLAMAVLCLFTYLYCIILQVTILARTIEASYIDDSQAGSTASGSGNNSLTMTRLTQTSFNPTYATSFREATRVEETRTTTRSKGMVEARQIYAILTTTPPADTSPSLELRNLRATSVSTPKPQSTPRKTYKNNAPAGDLAASCLYYNGSSLPKRGSLAVGLSVIHHLWFIALLVLMIFYENLRLRYNRHVHSAAVAGVAQSWIAVSWFFQLMPASRLMIYVQVEFMTNGVEAQLLVATAALLLIACINLIYGLPQTHSHRQSLFNFLISKPDHYSVPSSGKSYAVPQKKGQFMASASEVVKVLNEGIDIENRMLGRSPDEAFAKKISKYNVAIPDLEPYDNIPVHMLNAKIFQDKDPNVLARLYGKIPKRVLDQVVGGLVPFEATAHSLGFTAAQHKLMDGFIDNIRKGSGKDSGKTNSADTAAQMMQLQMLGGMMNQFKGGGGLAGAFGGAPTYPPMAYNPYAPRY